MGAAAFACVHDCVRSGHEGAVEVAGTPGRPSSSSAPAGDGSEVPPVPHWWQALKDSARGRGPSPAGSARLEEASARGSGGAPSARPGEEAQRGGAAEVSYEGGYLGALRHGTGVLKMVGSTYDGEFASNMKHGNGVLTWDDQRQYRGQFEEDRFHGFAVMTWPDGRRYTGQYQDDRKHGKGTFSWTDGRRYEGEWVGGKRHGVGVYTNAKGATGRGLWQADRPLRWEASGREAKPQPPRLAPPAARGASAGIGGVPLPNGLRRPLAGGPPSPEGPPPAAPASPGGAPPQPSYQGAPEPPPASPTGLECKFSNL